MKRRLFLFVFFFLTLSCSSDEHGNTVDDFDEDASVDTDTDIDSDTDTDTDTDTDSDSDSDTDSDTAIQYWQDRVDEFFGEAPDKETRLEVFEALWSEFAKAYACFDTYNIDWDEKRDHYRPLVEAATSYGRFVQLLNEMIGDLKDSHSILDSFKVCFENPSFDKPPRFRPYHLFPRIGGCVTLDNEDNLLVYLLGEVNPLGLGLGDIIVGLNNKTWQENLDEISSWKIPFCEDYGSNDPALRHNISQGLPNNPHLFDTIEVLKADTGEVESYSLEEVTVTNASYEMCTDQLPVAGVGSPADDWPTYDGVGCSNCLAYGIIDGTDVGYITVYAWHGEALVDFQNAVEELYDTTQGLIVDQRYNQGGVKPFIEYGFPVLFNESIDPVLSFQYRDDIEDYLSLQEHNVMAIDADPETYYDHPIAVLTGPKAGSAGDMCPYALRLHPRARVFGKPSNGAFGETTPMWNRDPFLDDLIANGTVAQAVSADGIHLQGSIQEPDVDVWLTKDDVMAGVDTVLEAALEWIKTENSK
ncbi:MAG: hypothetical protein GY854_21945 [Deltaproteobacteria bacterium]|nr:hypothetical protein [Deltaproteobacteria bacterium]